MSRQCLLDCSANGAKWADDVQCLYAMELFNAYAGCDVSGKP